MKALRSLVILGILCALPVVAMWGKIRPRLGPWADDAEVAFAEMLQQTGFGDGTTQEAEPSGDNHGLEGLPRNELSEAPQPTVALPKPPAAASPEGPPPVVVPDINPESPRDSADETGEPAATDPRRRTLQRPVYRPLGGETAETIQRRTNPGNITRTEDGHETARLDAAKITDRLQQLGAAGYRLQTDDQTGGYHFEASFTDPRQPEGVRRFSAVDTDGQLAMQQVLSEVETWQEAR